MGKAGLGPMRGYTGGLVLEIGYDLDGMKLSGRKGWGWYVQCASWSHPGVWG